jgi:hypothetical protein
MKRDPGPASSICELKITLRRIEPPIWRQVRVPSSVSLYAVHAVIQAAFGWTDSHLHEFRIGDAVYAEDNEYEEREVLDEYQTTLGSALDAAGPRNREFLYIYDLGDYWEHEVSVEIDTHSDASMRHAQCIAGERRCPPEDCGGTSGYDELCYVLTHSDHEDYQAMLDWVGGSFDPEEFDLAETNQRLRATIWS